MDCGVEGDGRQVSERMRDRQSEDQPSSHSTNHELKSYSHQSNPLLLIYLSSTIFSVFISTRTTPSTRASSRRGNEELSALLMSLAAIFWEMMVISCDFFSFLFFSFLITRSFQFINCKAFNFLVIKKKQFVG